VATKPVKASLATEDGDISLDFVLNPTEYTISSGTSWKTTPAKGKKAPKTEYTGTLPRTLSLTIQLIDQWNGVKTDVSAACDTLYSMAVPTDDSISKKAPTTPILWFSWAADQEFFACHLKTLQLRFTAFDAQGDPIRATAQIVLEEVHDEPWKQNPTSGGPPGNRAHAVAEGDTLASIAWREYDDASLWRGLADLNGIDDPMRLRIGQRLIVPPQADVAARS
jgi:hypothetical protein